uniref:Uncharacterized protein n=1 Tax=Porcine lymphotropic herpesvirus 3 TaxID=199308 RepID=Q8B410_9GAMA|nr:unknown [Porcine lymphotropic herpesvirus 3]
MVDLDYSFDLHVLFVMKIHQCIQHLQKTRVIGKGHGEHTGRCIALASLMTYVGTLSQSVILCVLHPWS